MPNAPHNSAALRVLLIDDGRGLSSRLEAMLHDASPRIEARSLPGYLMAMGELGVSDDPPHAIIGPIATLNGDMRATADALHELAPTTRLIAIVDPAKPGQAQRAIEAGFDDCLTEPATVADLSRSLAFHDDEEDDDAASARVASQAMQRETQAPAHPATPYPRSYTASLASPFDAPATPPLDTDILDQIINPRGQVQEHALRFIEENSNIPGIHFVPATTSRRDAQTQNAAQTQDDAQTHDDCVSSSTIASTPVVHLGITFGQLTAPAPATADHLKPWAAWLSRWLLLHRQQQDLWFMAMRDELTQAWNRRYFRRFLNMTMQRAAAEGKSVTLLLFDVDDFKKYNDQHGHTAGDDILRETVKLMQSVVREEDVVARIGGDEFAVIFWDAQAPRRANSRHPADIAKIAERFRKVLAAHKFPKLTREALGQLTISGGLASYPWDATTPEDLIAAADRMTFQSKREGKNKITFGPGM